MLRQLKDRVGERAFTLVELAVAVGIVILLTAIVYAVILSPGDQGSQNACNANLKAINAAIRMYYNDKGFCPSSLKELAEYGIGERSCFCPIGHSYNDLYLSRDVYRHNSGAAYNLAYFIGCPWHGRANNPDKNKTVAVLLDGSTIKADVCQAVLSNLFGNVKVLRREDYREDMGADWNWNNRAMAAVNNMKLSPADKVWTGSASSAKLAFADSSCLDIGQETRLTILQSCKVDTTRISSGYHSAIRIEDETNDPQVTYSRDSSLPKTYFEIATPALIAGIRGTELKVYKYLIEVTQASTPVELFDRFSQQVKEVKEGEAAGITDNGEINKDIIGATLLQKLRFKVNHGRQNGWRYKNR